MWCNKVEMGNWVKDSTTGSYGPISNHHALQFPVTNIFS